MFVRLVARQIGLLLCRNSTRPHAAVHALSRQTQSRRAHYSIETGRFGTASEVVRAGLRLLELEEKKLEALRVAIDEGDASPDAKGNAFARVRKTLKLKRRRG